MFKPTIAYELYVEDILDKLLKITNEERIVLKYEDYLGIAYISKSIFSKESMLLEVSAPIKICGDIHGQYTDLLRMFALCGYPPKTRYLFLGDYVDRGTYGLECICLLFCMKIKYPNHLYLLRGNHECDTLNRSYGFRDEIRRRFSSSKIWKSFLKTFNYLPVAAIVENTIFCCHGGLSPALLSIDITNLKDVINTIERPTDVPLEGLMCDLLWADPTDMENMNSKPMGWQENDRGCSWTFGFDIVEQFLERFDLDLIIRGHQVVEDGYEFYCNRKLITVFTAPNYCGKFDNAGGIFCLTKDLNTPPGEPPSVEGSFTILKPVHDINHQWKKIPRDR